MILIVTRRDDLTADFLIQRLLDRDIEYRRFDVDYILKDVFVESRIRGSDDCGFIETPQGSAKLSDIGPVWYRRALSSQLHDLPLEDSDRPFVVREVAHHLQGTIGTLSAHWVNHWQSVTLAERKLSQLRVASDVGFDVPETIVSSRANDLRRFADDGPTITKPISWGLHQTPDGFESVYTSSFTASDIENDDQAGLCPTLLQRRVAKVADIRMTVVGDKNFTARLEGDFPDGLDWRRPETDVSYSETEPPESIVASAQQLMAALNLRYGAFDFAVDESGQWWFLEVNPAGEFAWIEMTLGFPIRDAIIDELICQT